MDVNTLPKYDFNSKFQVEFALCKESRAKEKSKLLDSMRQELALVIDPSWEIDLENESASTLIALDGFTNPIKIELVRTKYSGVYNLMYFTVDTAVNTYNRLYLEPMQVDTTELTPEFLADMFFSTCIDSVNPEYLKKLGVYL